MIDLFKFKKKDIKSLETEEKSHYTESFQNIPTQNIGYEQLNQNYPIYYEKPQYREQQSFHSGLEGPSNIYASYSQPQPQYYQQVGSANYNYDWESYIQGIVEDILRDRVENINKQISEIKIWKERIEIEVSKTNEKLTEIENRINTMYEILAKKIEEYDKGIKEATVEVEALHRLIRTMVPAISESAKELKETIEEIKQLRDQLRKV